MEWIKVGKDTPVKPELRLAAKQANISEAESFLYWFRLYSWADSQTADGFLPHLTLSDVAILSNTPEPFIAALASDAIKWLFPAMATASRPFGVYLSNWERHNGQSAKKRAVTARRVQKHRSKK